MEQIGISAKNLFKSYESGGKYIQPISDLSISVPRGSITAVIGESGSGKSTLLNLLAGIDLPDSGIITVAGEELGSLSVEAIAQKRLRDIGIVFQFFNLLPTLTLLQNITVPAKLMRSNKKEMNERANFLLEQLGILALAARYPHEVSGGEVQRAAIARALINNPKCILADEPTGNLDPETGKTITDLFQKLVHDNGVSCVIVTHNKAVSSIADNVLRLSNGRLH